MISGLNHITLAVSDLQASLQFYSDLLGCNIVHSWPEGAYLEVGGLWLCLTVCVHVERRTDYTHIAFSATKDNCVELRKKLESAQVQLWQDNTSEGDSLYILDPDGHQLEIHVGTLASRMEHIKKSTGVGLGCGTSV
ncbi:MAG: VOC family protein [Gammaproteobacteria bacterium]